MSDGSNQRLPYWIQADKNLGLTKVPLALGPEWLERRETKSREVPSDCSVLEGELLVSAPRRSLSIINLTGSNFVHL